MNDDLGPFLLFIVLGTILGVLLFAITQDIFGTTYKHGQIDALTGKIKYELVTNPDSTKTWEEK